MFVIRNFIIHLKDIGVILYILSFIACIARIILQLLDDLIQTCIKTIKMWRAWDHNANTILAVHY